jgi:hypothetical protein
MSPNPIRQIHQAFIRHWATAEATVESCSWFHDSDYMGVDAGHYDVAFSYKPPNSDQPVHGSFCYSGSRQIVPYHAGEKFPIRYSPKHPGHFYFAGAAPSYEKLEAILAMSLFALLAGYVLFAY